MNDAPQEATKRSTKLRFSSDKIEDDQQSGAVFNPVYVRRNVKMFAVSESEMKTISAYNTNMTTWVSVGSAALALLLACAWDIVLARGDVSESAWAFVGVCVIITLVSYGIAGYYAYTKKTHLNMILAESSE